MIMMATALVPSLWLSRAANPVPLQVVFSGLLILSVVMGYRGIRAWQLRPEPGHRLPERYLAAVGFNLIGLLTGLLTVTVLRLGWGGIAVSPVAIGIPLAGHQLLNRGRRSA